MKLRNKSLMERFDRSIASGTWNQLIWLLSVIVLLLILFIVIASVFDITIFEKSDMQGKIQGIMYHFLDAGNQSLEEEGGVWSQLLALMISLSGIIFFGGFLISTIINTIERRVDKVEQGLVIYKTIKEHYVIIGYGEMTINIIDEIFEKCCNNYKERADRWLVVNKLPRIIIMTNQNVAKVRSDIHSQVISDVENKIIIYAGNIESKEHLANLNIHTATQVYVLGERDEYGRDTKNIACVDILANLRGDSNPNLITVNVQFDRVPSYSIAQKLDIPLSYISANGKGATPSVFFRPFNFHENWSRLLWSYYSVPSDGYSPLDFEPMVGDKHVHLVIVGLNRMGRALFLEALRLCHYMNYNPVTGGNKTKITIIEKDLDEKLPFFKSQYPYIDSQIEDIEIEYIKAQVETDFVAEKIHKAAIDDNKLLTIAICIKDPDLALATGLNLPESVYYQQKNISVEGKNIKGNNMRTKVLIRQELYNGLGEILNKDDVKYKNVKIFGMLNRGVSYELLDDMMPMYINRNYNRLVQGRKTISIDAYNEIKDDFKSESNLGLKEWLSLSENFRWANRYQIDMYGYYLRVFKENGITEIADIDSKLNGELLKSLAKVEHRRWIAERTVSGWRQIRAEDNEKRVNVFNIHDLIIPFEDLSEDEKEKDYLPIKNILILDKVFNN